MTRPMLSVLISTVPRRHLMAHALFERLQHQAEGRPVEILSLCDNKTRTIGAKRQALLDVSQGAWVSWVDDDDQVSIDYVSEIQRAIEDSQADVITFPIRVTLDGEQDGHVLPAMAHMPKNGEPLAEYKPPYTFRPPHELCAWRAEIARKGRFPDTNIGEDFGWARQVWPYVRTEHEIPRSLYWYRFQSKLAECAK